MVIEQPAEGAKWTEIVTAISTPLVAVTVAVLAGLIAYRQWKVARYKLNLDLFERRWKIYAAAQKLIGTAAFKGAIEDKDLQAFLDETHGAEWLFDDRLGAWLSDEVYMNAVELQDLMKASRIEEPGVDRTRERQRRTELKKWFNGELSNLKTRFGQFMKIES